MKKNELKFQVEADTSVLKLKLRAIAKHATALADELDEIDRETCPRCGSTDFVITTLYAGGQVYSAASACDSCGFEQALSEVANDDA